MKTEYSAIKENMISVLSVIILFTAKQETLIDFNTFQVILCLWL